MGGCQPRLRMPPFLLLAAGAACVGAAVGAPDWVVGWAAGAVGAGVGWVGLVQAASSPATAVEKPITASARMNLRRESWPDRRRYIRVLTFSSLLKLFSSWRE